MKFGMKVKIVSGFFQGQQGELVDCREYNVKPGSWDKVSKTFLYKNKNEYQVKFGVKGSLTKWFDVSELEVLK